MYDCVTIGDIKLDTFVVLHDASVQCQLKMPECLLCIEYGKKISTQVADTQIAGSAPNVATGLSRMKFKSAVFSLMGRDYIYELACKKLADEGVDSHYVKTKEGAHSSTAVVINYKGEKTILASHEPLPYELPRFAKTKWIYICELGNGYPSLYRQIIKKIKADHTHIAANPGSVQIEERKKELYALMKRTRILFLNTGEARVLTKIRPTANIKNLLAATWKLNRAQVVVTDGRNGAYSFDGEVMWFLPMFPGKRVEATGAGDAFACGALAGMMKGLNLSKALRWGAVNSASVVGKVGPTAGLLTSSEIKKRLASHPSFKAKKL